MEYVKKKNKMQPLTWEQAQAALKKQIRIYCMNSYPEPGWDEKGYLIHEIKSQKEMECIYNTVGYGIEHRAYVHLGDISLLWNTL